MVAITATAWTLTVQSRAIHQKERTALVKMVLAGDQGLTYPSSGGIPLPTTVGNYGMKRNISYITLVEAAPTPSADVTWKMQSVTALVLRGYMSRYTMATALAGLNPSGHVTELAELPTTWSPSLAKGPTGPSPVFYVKVYGW